MIQGAIIGAAVILLLLVAGKAQAGTGAKAYAFVWHVDRPANLGQLIALRSGLHSVKPEIVAAVVYVESRGNPTASNPADPSYGIGQMTLTTARKLANNPSLTKEDLFRPEFALDLTAQYLSILQNRYASRLPLTEWVQAYNVGETKFDAGGRNQLYGAKVQSLKDGSQVFLQTGQIAQEFARAGVGL